MYWDALEKLMAEHEVVVDRPKGSRHPRYPNIVYPVDYGYLRGTTAVDGNAIDIFVGTGPEAGVDGVVCTVDLLKNDAEIKILYRCLPEEIEAVLRLLNNDYMSALLVENREK